jgi:tetratricopeptide (TPR) repeat protein
MVTTQEQVRVLDFGLSTTTEQARGTVGTLLYMAPEVLRDQPVSQASDLYAVGIIAYQLLVGHYPFDLRTPARLTAGILHTVPDVSSVQNTRLADILRRWVAKDPRERYENATQIIQALSQTIDQLPPQESSAIRESFLQAATFVGRGEELQQLQTALDRAVAGHGSTWLVGGESGVGKSRLVEELRIIGLVQGARVLRTQGVEGGGLPYNLWREPLRRLVLADGLNDGEAGILKEMVPDIDVLLGRDIPEAPFLAGKDGQQRLVLMIADLFRRQTRQQPLVLILEDLQWATESLEPLKQLNRIVQDLPLLIVGNYRDDERPDLPDELEMMQVISLQRLSPESIADLSASMLGASGRQQQVVDLLQRETEGNIFFLIETVRALAEEVGQLSEVGRMTLPASVFAGGVQTVIQRRLDRVPATYHPLLKLTAVAGRQLDRAVLQEALRADDHFTENDLDQFILACADAAVLEVQEEQWRFAHDKLREHILSHLEDHERSHLHQQIAESIETLPNNDDDLATYAAILTQHWAAANNPHKEGHFAIIAGHQARENNANTDAVRLYQRALELNAFEQETDPIKAHADLLYNLGRARLGLSQMDEARILAYQALAIYESIEDRSSIGRVKGLLCEANLWQGNYDRALQLVDECLTIFRESDEIQQIGFALFNRGIIESYRGNVVESRDTLSEALEMMRRTGEPVPIARALSNLGIAHSVLGEYDRALEIQTEGLAIRRTINDRRGIAYSLHNMAELAEAKGDLTGAKAMYEEALMRLREIGEQHAIANALGSLARIARKHTGDYDEAERLHQEALTLRQKVGDKNAISASLHGLGDLAADRGDGAQAWRHYREALTVAAEIDAKPRLVAVLISIADLKIKQQQARVGLEILTCVEQFSGGEKTLLQRIEEGMAASKRFLAAELVDQIVARSKNLTLAQIMERILGEGDNL